MPPPDLLVTLRQVDIEGAHACRGSSLERIGLNRRFQR
jgi:hypothetical protein